MQIRDIMTPKVEFVDPDESIKEAACKMRDLDIGSLTVMEDGNLIGVITDRDICCRAVADGRIPATATVRSVMSKDVTYCFSDQDISEAARLMEQKHLRRLAVVDHDKQAVGFVTVDDLARFSHDLAGEVLEAASPATH